MIDIVKTGTGWTRPWRWAGWALVAAVLLAPLVAMRFTDEVPWTATDFAFAAGLLIGAGLLIELTMWKTRSRWRLGIVGAIVLAVLLIWADAAVGLF